MDDRTQPGRETADRRPQPSALNPDTNAHNGQTSSDARSYSDRLSSSKPPLTDLERNERWPVG
jgi:hypothetical protein